MARRRAMLLVVALVGLVVAARGWWRGRRGLIAPAPVGRWEAAPVTGASPRAGAAAPDVAQDRPAAPRDGAARNGAADDLQALKGVGPAMERELRRHGIHRYEDLAELDDDGIRRLEERLGSHGARLRRDDWVGQAAELARRRDTATT